ncbi:unnamed protein product [Lathyrus sativus]|nr:unnamed protein product [Lathyrus sativus]
MQLKDQSNKTKSDKTNIYVLYRKEALEMTRLASEHFKEATKAYQQKDHFSAKQHSMAGREKIRMVEEHNYNAAKEIFKINNCKNKIWRIDLHGVYGSEAIQILQRRLNEIIATQSKSLEVITGVGRHSHGKPVLPMIITKFLNENNYQFEEIRPGALKVWIFSSQNKLASH